MTEEVKETLEILKDFANNEISDYVYDYAGYEYETINNAINKVLDHITNLQQDLDKAIDTIEKNRQFYKCRMDEYIDLKKENEELKQTLHNITINDVEEKNTTVLDLINENERLKFENGNLKTNEQINVEVHNKQVEIIKDYKSRCEKTIEYINFVINHYKEQLETPIEDTYFDSDVNRKGYILSIIAYLQTTLDTLIGSDENE